MSKKWLNGERGGGREREGGREGEGGGEGEGGRRREREGEGGWEGGEGGRLPCAKKVDMLKLTSYHTPPPALLKA